MEDKEEQHTVQGQPLVFRSTLAVERIVWDTDIVIVVVVVQWHTNVNRLEDKMVVVALTFQVVLVVLGVLVDHSIQVLPFVPLVRVVP